MATAYTSLLGLALPVTGELSGTWGNTVNTEITALLDSAISGTTTISVDADITLTTTTGAANEAREAIILWTAGGTVTRNVTAPAQSKVYIVNNKSSSTQSIVLRGAGPTTGVTIVKDEKAVCAWNGSDFVKVSSSLISGLTGILPTANGGTALSSFTSGGALYATSTSVLVSGTLPVASGGTNQISFTAGQIHFGSFSTSANLFWDNTNARLGLGTSSPAVSLAISATDAILLPNGTTGQRPTGAAGYMRYNSTTGAFEGYTTAWGSIGGGATGAGGDQIFYQNGQTVTTDYTITAGQNAGTFGPVTINSGITVTVPSGSTWSVV